jgi:hypothetical protein
MRKAPFIATAVALLLTVQAGTVLAGERHTATAAATRAVDPVEVRARDLAARLRPIMTQPSLVSSGPGTAAQTADIQVTYTNFSPAAQAAFEAAVTVWERRVVSSRVIRVDAEWKPLGSGVLGSAGPTFIHLHQDNRWYATPLSEAICDCSRPNTPFDIEASFNSTFSNWYLQTDGNTPSDKYDFFTVVLHELGHGLGFLSSFRSVLGQIRWGETAGGPTYPMRYDQHEWTRATGGNQLINTSLYPNGSQALRTQATDGSVFFGGPNVVAANGGRARLYAPNPWAPGSSNSHFDETYFPPGDENALMTPFLSDGEVIHDPGPVTLALLRDIGWETSDEPGDDVSPPLVSPPTTTFLQPQTVGAAVAVEVAWQAAEDESGIASYSLQRKKNTGAWTSVSLPTPTSTSVEVDLAPGSTYRFRLTATDSAGNTSAPVMNAAAKLARAHETATAVSYSGAWTRVAVSGANGGYVRRSSTPTDTATYSFAGSEVGFVSTLGPNRGIAELRLDGALVATIDLYAPTQAAARLVWSDDVAPGSHVVEVRVTGDANPSSTGDRVDVDAFLAWK